MANISPIRILKKAGLIVCFFLSTTISFAVPDQVWQFSEEMLKAYRLVLNLQPDKAQEILSKISSPAEELHKIYVLSLSETVDILITEDQKRFDQLETNFRQRLQHIDNLPESAEKLFLEAELNLQKGFNLLNMGQNLNAVLAIRRAYNTSQECIKKYPTFAPIKKTYGVIQVMIGSVPDKYHWFMSLLGMRGSVVKGQKLLQELRESRSSLSTEATILFFCIKGFINQQFAESALGFSEILKEQPENRLVLFIAINMCMKDAQSEKALEYMATLDHHNQGLQMYYIEYLHAEALLNKGEYQNAIAYYQKFLRGYHSQSFKKDAHYKIAICNWLLNNEAEAKIYFERAKTVGRDQADPDKNAAMQLLENKFPNKKLLRVRYFTDGGFYKEAQHVVQSIQFTELHSLKEQTEYFYRLARLAHKTEEFSVAKIYYEETIKLSKENPWYFAPNAALQLGYIYRDQNDFEKAKKYFELAMSYRRHEYKSSIDTKSRSALDQMKASKG
ncbi:MAG: tetratricopeptide repeat protein [Bacteroidetes bacterium]|nr:tetratricopeptide repeat protein [Bacteroidota bacterium]